MSSAVGQAF